MEPRSDAVAGVKPPWFNGSRAKRRVAAGWAVVIVLGIYGCSAAAPAIPKIANTDNVVAFGDSLTFGTGAGENENYPAVLARLIGHAVIAAGVPGETTAQGLQRLPEILDAHRPKVLILCMGGNDMLRQVDDAQIVAKLRAMIAMARARGANVVLLGVPRPTLFGGAPQFYQSISEEFGLPYEGEVIPDVLHSPRLKSDPIHPNAEGYRRIAKAVAALLRDAGAL
ncbi:MAG: arylesterase [Burkholderiales bacterium]